MNEMIKILNGVKTYDYITTSKIQRNFSLGFIKANDVLNYLKDLGVISEKNEKQGYKVYNEKIIELLKGDEQTLEIRLEELLAKRRWLKEQLNK